MNSASTLDHMVSMNKNYTSVIAMALHRMTKIQAQNMPRKRPDSKSHLSLDVLERLSFDVIKLHPMRTRNEGLVDDVYRKCQ